ncbi:putative enzyme [Frankia canadensis]|uniref:S-adenosyl-L-methionine-dependent methyltransferase n=1 Tax=Frankia canadensis TaxID=1836972 RepID=A0A2I2KSI7_9ACTN|nr:SAM-dependent methyltransferase [Frankia canadensis]SNQ48638.1 putative enzyme [Frankia canadensis]SOU55928.1 putative enzyme [Frankia canadensis]
MTTFRATSDRVEAPGGVGRTAVGMAWIRARESARPDRLFDDPYAQAFVDAAGGGSERMLGLGPAGTAPTGFTDLVSSHGVLRTRFFDDYVTGAAAGGHRQIVLLAAGLDSRAQRLDWPAGTRLFEVDLPAMLAFKQAVLDRRRARARCERVAVPADLAGDWTTALAGAGFAPDRATAWLAEGLLPYLDDAQADRLLTTVTGWSAPGSRLGFEYRTGDDAWLLDELRHHPELAEFAALIHGGLAEPAQSWLPRHGWRITRDRLRTDLAAEAGRPSALPMADGFLVAGREGAAREEGARA